MGLIGPAVEVQVERKLAQVTEQIVLLSIYIQSIYRYKG